MGKSRQRCRARTIVTGGNVERRPSLLTPATTLSHALALLAPVAMLSDALALLAPVAI
jgi:hypothetical protein